ncbi:hypothetical protein CONCODRAFT_11952 [Conidiobolus coronatus NRRL 28638]|uniref:Uncharacterized protein n=1 Tax=Conidiobolus coronatus (strain ATCC 28846 / CBS 209.66 / NRRL 28638) TaxID=796925 RepID=A0A137NU28_CONC2|nr:hypothetical protein CONCODRAFT_11952 [Conidiobolus coronatus NRRL 28638]|eukprot:KXN66249.1 hypothetical protein CONCODRAFT_11952 [Conidiobolus coronatus NRRL 28638]
MNPQNLNRAKSFKLKPYHPELSTLFLIIGGTMLAGGIVASRKTKAIPQHHDQDSKVSSVKPN